MFRYLAVIVVPAIALACCPPKLWEGRQYVAIGSTSKDGTSHYTEIAQNVSIDGAMRRSYIKQSLTVDGYPVQQAILQDFGEGHQFVTNLNTGRCEKMDIDAIEPGCIPANATKVIQSFFGTGDHKVMATMYKFSMAGTTVYSTMADDGCIPLAYEASGPTKDGGGYQMTVEFFGITPGIVDTSVFQTPSMCPSRRPVFTGVGK